jgi:hypothetical protein
LGFAGKRHGVTRRGRLASSGRFLSLELRGHLRWIAFADDRELVGAGEVARDSTGLSSKAPGATRDVTHSRIQPMTPPLLWPDGARVRLDGNQRE